MQQSEIITAVTTIVVLIAVFLIFRNLILWFWRVNEQTDTLKEISTSMSRLVTEVEKMSAERNRKYAVVEPEQCEEEKEEVESTPKKNWHEF